MPTHLPEDSLRTPRFVGITTFMRLPHTRDLAGADVAVVGIPFDTGSPFRVGCRFGPAAVRAMSLMLRPISPYHRLNVFAEIGVVDYGDTDLMPGYLPQSFARIEAALAPIVAAGVIPLGIGGDHSIALPELRALGRRYGPTSLSELRSWSGQLGAWGSRCRVET
jgi:agmatinase